MSGTLFLWALLCGPLALALGGWAILRWSRERSETETVIALGVVTASAAWMAGMFAYYRVFPTASSLPPWEDPAVLDFAWFLLLAPVGMVLSGFAARRGAPRGLVAVMMLASAWEFVVSMLISATV